MRAVITVDNKLIIDLIHRELVEKLGEAAAPSAENIKVKVRSRQNYRNQAWEDGEMQVTYEGEL